MQESLVCSVCEKTWKRNKTRGRKPTVCPKCLKSSIQVSEPKQKQPNQKSKAKISESIKSIVDDKKTSDVTYKQIYKSLYPKDPSFEELRESTKNGSIWKCQACANIIRLDVAVTAIPTHKCNPNSNKINLYERIG
jgi:hypothetical protein